MPSAIPTSGYEMSAAPASSLEEMENIGLSGDDSRHGAAQLERLKLTRKSHPSLVIRAHEREIHRDLGVPRELETRFCWRRQGTVACGRRSPSCLARSTCCRVPRQSRRRLSCRKGTKRPRPRSTTRTSSGRTDGRSWSSTTRMVRSAPVYTPSEHAALAAPSRRSTFLLR